MTSVAGSVPTTRGHPLKLFKAQLLWEVWCHEFSQRVIIVIGTILHQPLWLHQLTLKDYIWSAIVMINIVFNARNVTGLALISLPVS